MRGKWGAAIVLAIAGCSEDPKPPTLAGVPFRAPMPDVPPPGSGSTTDGGAPPGVVVGSPPAASCDRGLVVVASNYQNTAVVLANLDGRTRSPFFASSEVEKPGLRVPLSGDVDVPTTPPESGRVVLIDRFGTNVITWLKPDTAEVIAQLPVGQGFESNPHDYVEVDATRAFVTRFGSNPTSGGEAFDGGGDVLVIDTQTPAILGRVAIPEEDARLHPSPSGMAKLRDEVVVTLGRWSPDFSIAGDGRFVGIAPATGSVAWTVDVKGLAACGRVAVSPSGARLAIACSSRMDRETRRFDTETSDVVIYDAQATPPKEVRRLGLAQKLNSGIQPDIAFSTEDLLIAKSYGGNSAAGDRIVSVHAVTGEYTPLAQSQQPFAFGGVHCSPACGGVCLVADAEERSLRRWWVSEAGALEPIDSVLVDGARGLPPRTIGAL